MLFAAAGALSFQVLPSTATAGECMPIESQDLPIPRDLDQRRVCEAAAIDGACEQDAVCAPRPTGDLERRLCISIEDDIECPEDGPFGTRFVITQGFMDSRECELACECAQATGTCVESVTLHEGSNCGSPVVVTGIGPEHGCEPVAGFQSGESEISVETAGCEASGATLVGELKAKDPVTVCCSDLL
jgi:hypothetical protein